VGSALIKGISGGEKKRVCIGVELVTDPIVIILDGKMLFA
jgi:ABC-type multidrug transport system ATPase subunit